MATLGLFGLLLGGWLAESRDAGRSPLPRPSGADVATLVGASAAAVAVLDFDFFLDTQAPSTFLLMLVIAWVAVRFTPVVTSAFCLLTGSVVIGLTIANKGTLSVVTDPVLRAGLAQLLVVVLMVLGMVISLSRQQVLDSLASLARSEAANARRAQELDLVMANLDDGVAIIEKSGKILHANTALRTAFGTQEENTELDKVRDDSEIPDEERLLRGSDGAMLTDEISPLTRAFDGVAVPAEEWRSPSPDGPIKWVTISAVPLPPDEGGSPRAMIVLRDISGEKAHQEALETRAAELNLVIDNLNDGLAIVEEGGTYTQANDALRTIFWGTPDAIEASGDIDAPAAYHIYHPDGRPLEDDEFPYKRALSGIVGPRRGAAPAPPRQPHPDPQRQRLPDPLRPRREAPGDGRRPRHHPRALLPGLPGQLRRHRGARPEQPAQRDRRLGGGHPGGPRGDRGPGRPGCRLRGRPHPGRGRADAQLHLRPAGPRRRPRPDPALRGGVAAQHGQAHRRAARPPGPAQRRHRSSASSPTSGPIGCWCARSSTT